MKLSLDGRPGVLNSRKRRLEVFLDTKHPTGREQAETMNKITT